MCDPVILPSARKRGYPDADIMHAYRNAIYEYMQDDDMLMKVGGTPSGALMEVGVVVAQEWDGAHRPHADAGSSQIPAGRLEGE